MRMRFANLVLMLSLGLSSGGLWAQDQSPAPAQAQVESASPAAAGAGPVEGEKEAPAGGLPSPREVKEMVPELALVPRKVTIPTDFQGFQGEKPETGDSVTYELPMQVFRETAVVPVADTRVPKEEMLAMSANPFMTVLLSSGGDKAGDKTRILELVKPDCVEKLDGFMDARYVESAQRMYRDVTGIRLVLAVEKDGLLYVAFKPVRSSGEEGRVTLLRVLSKVDGRYLLDCADLSDTAILNIYGLLMRNGIEALIGG